MTRQRVIALAILVGAIVAIRAPSLAVPILNEDEALYAATAASMAEGAPPYRAGVESKPPGIFYLYEAGFAITGRYNMIGIHALTMLWVLGTALLVGAIAKRVRPEAELPAALLYVAFTIVEEPAVMASQCELLYSLPLAAAAFLLIKAITGTERRRAGEGLVRALLIVIAGVLCGLGTLIKPTAISLPVAATGFLALRRWLVGGPDRVLVDLGRAALLWFGFALAWLGAYAYFSSLGVWDDLIYWAFKWTLGTYIPTGNGHSPWVARFLAGFCGWLGLASVLWVLAILGFKRRTKGDQIVWFLFAWTGCATALTFLGGRFFDHYFPAVIPPLAALGGLGYATLVRKRLAILAAAVPVLACWLAVWNIHTVQHWFGEPIRHYDGIADYIDAHSAPDDRVFVWGYFPPLYVAADRLAATRYTGCHYVTGYAAIGLGRDLPPEIEDKLGVPDGFAILLRDLEHYRPVLLVDTAPADLHHWKRYPLSRYPILAQYVSDHYVREATVQDAVIYRRRP